MRIEFVLPEALRTAPPDTRKEILSDVRFFDKLVDVLVSRLNQINRIIDHCYERRYSLKRARELITWLETKDVKELIEHSKGLTKILNDLIEAARKLNKHVELELCEKTLKPIITTIEKKAEKLTEPFSTETKTLSDYYTILEELEKRKHDYAEELLKLKAILITIRYLLTSRII